MVPIKIVMFIVNQSEGFVISETKTRTSLAPNKYFMRTYGSSRLKLRPLQPFVGLDATNAASTATTAKQRALQESLILECVQNIYFVLTYEKQMFGLPKL